MSILALTSNTLIGTPAAGNIEYNGQFFGTDSAASRAQLQRITQGTAVATTSGTSIDFTGLPAWVKRITLMNVGVSTNGSSTLMVQLGTSGGIDTTSTYKGSSWQANITITNFSNGVLLGNSNSAATLNNHQVVFTLALPASNTWVVGGVGSGDAGNPQVIAGSKALSGALTTLRLTTANGTDIFDAGSTNILYEG